MEMIGQADQRPLPADRAARRGRHGDHLARRRRAARSRGRRQAPARRSIGNDAGFAARFKQEARAAGSLSHPNIVPVYDYGTDADGAQFIVMQLVEGDDLAALLRERRPPGDR